MLGRQGPPFPPTFKLAVWGRHSWSATNQTLIQKIEENDKTNMFVLFGSSTFQVIGRFFKGGEKTGDLFRPGPGYSKKRVPAPWRLGKGEVTWNSGNNKTEKGEMLKQNTTSFQEDD